MCYDILCSELPLVMPTTCAVVSGQKQSVYIRCVGEGVVRNRHCFGTRDFVLPSEVDYRVSLFLENGMWGIMRNPFLEYLLLPSTLICPPSQPPLPSPPLSLLSTRCLRDTLCADTFLSCWQNLNNNIAHICAVQGQLSKGGQFCCGHCVWSGHRCGGTWQAEWLISVLC